MSTLTKNRINISVDFAELFSRNSVIIVNPSESECLDIFTIIEKCNNLTELHITGGCHIVKGAYGYRGNYHNRCGNYKFELSWKNIDKIKFPPNIKILSLDAYDFHGVKSMNMINLPSELHEFEIYRTEYLSCFKFHKDLHTLRIICDCKAEHTDNGYASDGGPEYNSDDDSYEIYDLTKMEHLDNLQVLDITELTKLDMILPNSVHTLYCNSGLLHRVITPNIRNLYIKVVNVDTIIKFDFNAYINLHSIHLTRCDDMDVIKLKLAYDCSIHIDK